MTKLINMNSPDQNIITYFYNCMTYETLHCEEETCRTDINVIMHQIKLNMQIYNY